MLGGLLLVNSHLTRGTYGIGGTYGLGGTYSTDPKIPSRVPSLTTDVNKFEESEESKQDFAEEQLTYNIGGDSLPEPIHVTLMESKRR